MGLFVSPRLLKAKNQRRQEMYNHVFSKTVLRLFFTKTAGIGGAKVHTPGPPGWPSVVRYYQIKTYVLTKQNRRTFSIEQAATRGETVFDIKTRNCFCRYK